MDLKKELTSYLSEINSIKKALDLDGDLVKLNEILNDLDNYFEQINAINSVNSSLFEPKTKDMASNKKTITQINTRELKYKLLFKINAFVNKNLELLDEIL